VIASHELALRTVKLVGLVLALLWLVPSSSAATITVGSDLTQIPNATPFSCDVDASPCTLLSANVHTGNAYPRASPTKGKIVAFGIRTGVNSDSDTVTFRVGQLGSIGLGVAGKAVATGPKVNLTTPGIYTFPGPGPTINVWDVIGVDVTSTDTLSVACGNGAYYDAFRPVLPDGGPLTVALSNAPCELMVNAEVQPSSVFKFSKLQGNFKKGIAWLTVSVPGPGELSLSGNGVRKAVGPTDARASMKVDAAGDVKLKVVPKGRAKGTLEESGRVKLKVNVTFTPIGGDPATESVKVKLKKKL
jgi:hypothetical protein